MHPVPQISLIAALGKDRVIGKENGLLWHIPGDLKRFKKLTTGHPVLMGRTTWESLPQKVRPLPNRTNIVLSRDPSYETPGAHMATSLEAGLAVAATAPGADEVFVMGGGMVYAAALPMADRLYLTLVEDASAGDVFFPPYENLFPTKTAGETHEENGIRYTWVTLDRN